MKTFMIARKLLLELWREPKLLLLFLFFPALMVGMYDAAFGPSASGLASFLRIFVVNQDAGGTGAFVIESLRAAEFDGKPVFAADVVESAGAAQIALAENKAALLLIIPPEFSATLSTNSDPNLVLYGDQASDNYAFAASFLKSLVRDVTLADLGYPAPQPIAYEFLPNTGTLNDFQFGVPGCILFGVMFTTITAATVLVREDVNGTLRRLRLSGVGARAVILGLTLAHMILACVQMPIALGTALLFGFAGAGSPLLFLGIGILLSLSATGFGLIAACLAHDDGAAVGLGTLFMMPLVFMSGALFALPPALIAIGDVSFNLYDLLPTTHAAEALRRVLIYGDGLDEIGTSLTALIALSILTLAAGVALFGRLRLKDRT